jgi:hypothetical protein
MCRQPHIKLGQTVIDLVATFPATFQTVSCFYFKTYRPVPGVRDRLKVTELSIPQLRERYARPDILINEMLKHVNDDETHSVIEVRADEFAHRLPQLAKQSYERQEALAIYSMCQEKSGEVLHIPMMDFRLASGSAEGQLDLLRTALQGIRQNEGLIIDSGNSYHYYGLRLLPEGEWRWFMAGCLLLEPLVDVRYVSHRLLAGKASLRLTTAPGKATEPRVVSRL